MSRLTDLIRQAKEKDPTLGQDLEAEIAALSSRRQFGLNFERHQPEAVELPGRLPRKGDKVRVLPPRGSTAVEDQRLWKVAGIDSVDGTAVAHLEITDDDGDVFESAGQPVDDVVVVAEFRDPIYPGLRSTGRVERGGDKPHHTVINAPSSAKPNHWIAHAYPLAFRVDELDHEQIAYACSQKGGTREAKLSSFYRLAEHARVEDVVNALATFLYHALPSPASTEQRNWVVTAFPRTDDGLRRLATLTVENMQLLTFVERVGARLQAVVNLAPSPRISSSYGAEEIDFQAPYGLMQHASMTPQALVAALGHDQDFRAAARNAATSLVEKGHSIIGALHSRLLADALYANIFRSTNSLHNVEPNEWP